MIGNEHRQLNVTGRFPPLRTVRATFIAHGAPPRIVAFGKLLSGYVRIINYLLALN